MNKICIKCKNEIPSAIKIDGKRRNLCNRKYCFNCSPWGSKNTRKLEKLTLQEKIIDGKKHVICQNCFQEKLKYKGDKCINCMQLIWRKKTKKRAYEFKFNLVKINGGCCNNCGYKKTMLL